jgi:hypothetical protein
LLVPITLGWFAIAGALPPFAPSTWALFALLLVVGAGSGALDVAINARASSLETVHDVRILDGFHAFYSGGVVVGAIGAGLLRRAGVHPTAILVGVGIILLLVAAANLRVERLPASASRHAALTSAVLVIGAVFAISALLESSVESWSALLVENGLHATPAVSGLGPGLFAAAMVAGRLFAQRAPRARTSIRIVAAGLAGAAGLGITAAAARPALALVGIVIAGLGLAISVPTLFRLAGRTGGEPAIATVAVVGYLGFMAGPPLTGAVAGATSLRGGFVFLAVAAGLLVTTAPILRRLDSDSQR